jgi:hypothetical protein
MKNIFTTSANKKEFNSLLEKNRFTDNQEELKAAAESYHQKFPLLKPENYKLLSEAINNLSKSNQPNNYKILKALNNVFDRVVSIEKRNLVLEKRGEAESKPTNKDIQTKLKKLEVEYDSLKETLLQNNNNLAIFLQQHPGLESSAQASSPSSKPMTKEEFDESIKEAEKKLGENLKSKREEILKDIADFDQLESDKKEKLVNTLRDPELRKDFVIDVGGTETKLDLLSAALLKAKSLSAIRFLMDRAQFLPDEAHLEFAKEHTSDIPSNFIKALEIINANPQFLINSLTAELEGGKEARPDMVEELFENSLPEVLKEALEIIKKDKKVNIVDLALRNCCPPQILKQLLEKGLTPSSSAYNEFYSKYNKSYPHGMELLATEYPDQFLASMIDKVKQSVSQLFQSELSSFQKKQNEILAPREAKAEEAVATLRGFKESMSKNGKYLASDIEKRITILANVLKKTHDTKEEDRVYLPSLKDYEYKIDTTSPILNDPVLPVNDERWYSFIKEVLKEGNGEDVRILRKSGYFDLMPISQNDLAVHISKLADILGKELQSIISTEGEAYKDKAAQLLVIYQAIADSKQKDSEEYILDNYKVAAAKRLYVKYNHKFNPRSVGQVWQDQKNKLSEEIGKELEKSEKAEAEKIEEILGKDGNKEIFEAMIADGSDDGLIKKCFEKSCPMRVLRRLLKNGAQPKDTANKIYEQYYEKYSQNPDQALDFLSSLQMFRRYDEAMEEKISNQKKVILSQIAERRKAGEVECTEDLVTLKKQIDEQVKSTGKIEVESIIRLNEILDRGIEFNPAHPKEIKFINKNDPRIIDVIIFAINQSDLDAINKMIELGFFEHDKVTSKNSYLDSMSSIISAAVESFGDKYIGKKESKNESALGILNQVLLQAEAIRTSPLVSEEVARAESFSQRPPHYIDQFLNHLDIAENAKKYAITKEDSSKTKEERSYDPSAFTSTSQAAVSSLTGEQKSRVIP